MKKFSLKTIFIALSALCAFNTTALATDPVAGKEYIEVRKAPSAQKEVIEFFSFYCPHCYDFEFLYKIPSQIKAQLPKDTKLVQYHVDFLGRQSENLTRAWALAMVLGVEDKVKTALFEGARKEAFKSMDDIRAVFLANGITADIFDNYIKHPKVESLYNTQKQLSKEFPIRGVPAFFVNGQYQINAEGFSNLSINDFSKRYVEVAVFLSK